MKCANCGFESDATNINEIGRQYIGDEYEINMTLQAPYCEYCGSLLNNAMIEFDSREFVNKKILELKSLNNN